MVTLRKDGAIVGMGRIVGDGAFFVEIIDVVVDPTFQGMGLGKIIMEELMAYATTQLSKGAFAYLTADAPADRLYVRLGFKETAPDAGGMCYRVGLDATRLLVARSDRSASKAEALPAQISK